MTEPTDTRRRTLPKPGLSSRIRSRVCFSRKTEKISDPQSRSQFPKLSFEWCSDFEAGCDGFASKLDLLN
ncbi:unnamed protein product [Soboliphyme baturini]|uniref:Uncharacterized protein n=1 Tax=Soboliphyme baturini TaxID=241478 RepID=A0A183IFC5_9BILA|nr:unnamed protein product [Soboliphyme baturini]